MFVQFSFHFIKDRDEGDNYKVGFQKRFKGDSHKEGFQKRFEGVRHDEKIVEGSRVKRNMNRESQP